MLALSANGKRSSCDRRKRNCEWKGKNVPVTSNTHSPKWSISGWNHRTILESTPTKVFVFFVSQAAKREREKNDWFKGSNSWRLITATADDVDCWQWRPHKLREECGRAELAPTSLHSAWPPVWRGLRKTVRFHSCNGLYFSDWHSRSCVLRACCSLPKFMILFCCDSCLVKNVASNALTRSIVLLCQCEKYNKA